MKLKTSDFDYYLPKNLIAQVPIEPRDQSRLMIVSRTDGSVIHSHFYELGKYLRPGDILVFNDSKVFPARLHANHSETGKEVELLLLRNLSGGCWHALVKPGRRMRKGDKFVSVKGDSRITGEILQVHEDGSRTLQLSGEKNLETLGIIPLPPYISVPLKDVDRYQTVYSRSQGSVAAPTAGLHFTTDMMDSIRNMGVHLIFVTLHVGWDSFRSIKTDDIESHEMHSEYWELDECAARQINLARKEGRRVISIGTTSVRVLEQAANTRQHEDVVDKLPEEVLGSGSGWADLFIYPGYKFRVIDGLLTNFHLPKSTLLMLTSAFANREIILKAYKLAQEHRYRFYSFGDAMLIL